MADGAGIRVKFLKALGKERKLYDQWLCWFTRPVPTSAKREEHEEERGPGHGAHSP